MNNIKNMDARIGQDKIAPVYDKIAPVYDVWGKLTESHARGRAIERAEIKDVKNIWKLPLEQGWHFTK